MVKLATPEATLLTALEDALRELLPAAWGFTLETDDAASGTDAVLKLVDPADRSFRLDVEVKARLAPAEFVRQVGWYAERGPWLIVAPRVGPRARELFDGAGISWIEPGEDCRIAVGGLLVDRACRSGRRRTAVPRAGSIALDALIVPEGRRYVADMFSGKALRVVRWLLIEPDRRWRLQGMADVSEASVGFISRVFATLEREAYLERDRDGSRLRDREALLDAWAAADGPNEVVAERVSLLSSPEAVVAAIRSLQAPPHYAATAEVAADQLAPFARFSRVDLYVDDPQAWDDLLGLTPVPRGGNVALITPPDPGLFDGAMPARGLDLVSRPQLYVDLIRRGGAAAEAARVLSERGELWRS